MVDRNVDRECFLITLLAGSSRSVNPDIPQRTAAAIAAKAFDADGQMSTSQFLRYLLNNVVSIDQSRIRMQTGVEQRGMKV